ncbi:MAG: hypothetical protein J1D88_01455 [Treponema sp.]|nr:hypothetical protein [Treponema sp.]
MIKPKQVAYAAAAGFVLSFLISVLVTHRFVPSLVRGLIFCAVFGALFVGVSLLYGKFLDDEKDDLGSDVSSEKEHAKTGGLVDITISDENLSDEPDGLLFNVDKNRTAFRAQVLHSGQEENASASPVADTAPQIVEPAKNGELSGKAEAPAAPATFQSISLADGAERLTSGAGMQEAVAKPDVGQKPRPSHGAEKKSAALDELPDIGDVSVSEVVRASPSMDSDGAIVEDSDFASGNGVSRPNAVASPAENHDTETLAKAISTVLKRDG